MNVQYLKERQLLILHLSKAVHDDSMSKSHTYRLTVQQELTKANGNLEKPVSTIKDKIAEQVKLIGNYTITYSSGDLSQVTSKIVRDKSYIVNLQSRTCSCKEWQKNGYPCRHACLHLLRHPRGAREPEDHAESFFQLGRFVRSHSRLMVSPSICSDINIYPVRLRSLVAMYTPVYQPIILENIQADKSVLAPAPKVTGPGRCETKRYRSRGETGGPRKKQVHRCSNCGHVGHNKTKCRNPYVPPEQWEPLLTN